MLLRPLPLEDPDRLVMVRGRWPLRDVEKAGLSTGNLADFMRDTTAFEEFAALSLGTMPITDGEGDPEQVPVAFASSNFFSLMGIDTSASIVLDSDSERHGVSMFEWEKLGLS